MMTSSCAMFLTDHGTFDGGEILDDDKMSEIRSKVFGSDLTEAEEITADESTVSRPADKVESETSAGKNETAPYTDSQNPATTEVPTENAGTVVYWTQNGEVWHLKQDCRYLKNKTVLSGSPEDAITSGKKRVCSGCGQD
jgi:hypothetical protein